MKTSVLKNLLKFTVVFYILLAILFTSLVFVKRSDRKKYTEKENTSHISTENKQTEVTREVLKPNFRITYDSVDGEKILYQTRIFGKYFPQEFQILNNYMFLKAEENSEMSLKRVNLETGQTDYFFNIEEKFDRIADYVTSIEKVNGKVFVFMTSYMEKSQVFVFNTSESDPVPFNTTGNLIESINGNYFISGGFGDGCGGNQTYDYLNPITLQTTFVIDLAIGCVQGYENLGIFENYFIIADSKGSETHESEQKYKTLELQEFVPPFTRITLLNNEALPVNTHSITYQKDINKLIILAEGVYQYDLTTRTLVKIRSLPKELVYSSIANISENYICIQATDDPSSYQYKYYRVSLVDTQYYEDKNCNNYVTYIPNSDQEISKDDLVKELSKLNLSDSINVYYKEEKVH